MPYVQHGETGAKFFVVKSTSIKRPGLPVVTSAQAYVTQKGKVHFEKVLTTAADLFDSV